jgi:transcriptional regulator with XRE-family HTH domain
MKVETAERRPPPLTDRLRQAISDSRMSFSKLAHYAKVSQPQLSRFMAGQRDLTLAVAANVCQVLGLDLVQAAPVLERQLDAPELTPRKRRELKSPAPFTETRGQGKRVDLEPRDVEPAEAAATAEPPPRRASRGRMGAATSADSPAADVGTEKRGGGKEKASGRRGKKKGA